MQQFVLRPVELLAALRGRVMLSRVGLTFMHFAHCAQAAPRIHVCVGLCG